MTNYNNEIERNLSLTGEAVVVDDTTGRPSAIAEEVRIERIDDTYHVFVGHNHTGDVELHKRGDIGFAILKAGLFFGIPYGALRLLTNNEYIAVGAGMLGVSVSNVRYETALDNCRRVSTVALQNWSKNNPKS